MDMYVWYNICLPELPKRRNLVHPFLFDFDLESITDANIVSDVIIDTYVTTIPFFGLPKSKNGIDI